jgi:hypothetical protein
MTPNTSLKVYNPCIVTLSYMYVYMDRTWRTCGRANYRISVAVCFTAEISLLIT